MVKLPAWPMLKCSLVALLIAGVCLAAVWHDLPPLVKRSKKRKRRSVGARSSAASEATLLQQSGATLLTPPLPLPPRMRSNSAYSSTSTLWDRRNDPHMHALAPPLPRTDGGWVEHGVPLPRPQSAGYH